jgi:hypothetical protein
VNSDDGWVASWIELDGLHGTSSREDRNHPVLSKESPVLAFRQLQSHVPLARFAKAPVPLPLQAQAAMLADEHDDGVITLQSAQ